MFYETLLLNSLAISKVINPDFGIKKPKNKKEKICLP